MGIATSSTVGAISGSVMAEPSGSITFEDQTSSDGQTLVIAEVEVEEDATLGIINQRSDESISWSTIEAGTYSNYEVSVAPPIIEESEVSVSLYPEGGGSSFARETAIVDVPEDLEVVEGIEPTLIEADPAAGFEYPFFIYVPTSVSTGDNDPKPVLVEPVNSGQSTDDMEVHLDAGDQLVESSQTRDIADRLGASLVIPVFPRPREEPVDWTHYIHALDDTSMSIEDSPLERVDLQLLNMVEWAHDFFESEGYPVRTDGILLNGFSASGNFVDRFAVLHPDEVISVTAGGLNGMPLLPLDEFEGRELPYHVGTADVEALTGSAVDREALDEMNQFLYMGSEDDNDTIGYGDAWTDDSLEQLALDVYGDHMIAERFPTAQHAYEEAGVSAQFRVYSDAGHTPRPAVDDIKEFHQRSLDGEDVSMFGEDVGTTLRIDVTSADPVSGSEINIDARESTVPGDAEILSYQWDFGDGEDGTGETTTHTYTEAGEFSVTLTVTTDQGTQHEETIEVVVDADDENTEAADSGETDSEGDGETDSGETDSEGDGETDSGETDSEGDDESDPDSDDESEATDDGSPGFGVGSALAGISGLGYMLKRRLSETEKESN